jgi:membrane-bound serine protease (ClpP class)
MRRKRFLFLLALVFLSGIIVSYADSHNSADKKVVLIEIDGTINPATFDYIRAGIDKAKENSAEALIILLDTPGGLLSSTKEIVQLILNSDVPIVIYVYPSGATATSAGVFITLSANIAAMAPGTSIGAAHPVFISPRKSSTKRLRILRLLL